MPRYCARALMSITSGTAPPEKDFLVDLRLRFTYSQCTSCVIFCQVLFTDGLPDGGSQALAVRREDGAKRGGLAFVVRHLLERGHARLGAAARLGVLLADRGL